MCISKLPLYFLDFFIKIFNMKTQKFLNDRCVKLQQKRHNRKNICPVSLTSLHRFVNENKKHSLVGISSCLHTQQQGFTFAKNSSFSL